MSVDVTERFRALAPLDDAVLRGVRAPRHDDRQQEEVVFDLQALELLHSLVEMEAMLREVRPRYLRPRFFIRSKGSAMSEKDKDEFDADVVELVRDCSTKIDALKDATDASRSSTTRIEHQREVVTYLLERLKSVANETKRMQRQRYDQPFLLSARLLPENERESLEDIEEKIKKAAMLADQREPKPVASIEKAAPTSAQAAPSPASSPRASSPSPRCISQPLKTKSLPPQVLPAKRVPLNTPPFVLASQSEELEFTEDESRRFKLENVMLQRHFQHNLEDAKKMESKMAAISNLMAQFADKIMEQQTDIELIHQHAQETNTNVAQSNRILEQTEKIGRGYGFMIFCVYVSFSVLLHLLHYFHD